MKAASHTCNKYKNNYQNKSLLEHVATHVTGGVGLNLEARSTPEVLTTSCWHAGCISHTFPFSQAVNVFRHRSAGTASTRLNQITVLSHK